MLTWREVTRKPLNHDRVPARAADHNITSWRSYSRVLENMKFS